MLKLTMALKERDVNDIKTLYYIHRFLPASIAKLYGISHVTVLNIVEKDRNVTMVSDTECLLCGLPDVYSFYIDGNSKNKRPQNVLSLCEADKRRLQHMQLRKKEGSLTSQF
jgi:hypothetical protein